MDVIAWVQSIWTIVVMIIFLSVVIWAYSSKRKAEFEEAARLPLDDDDSVATTVKEQQHHV
jgi:cytochrome c oxidase cbb3-type subunit 4